MRGIDTLEDLVEGISTLRIEAHFIIEDEDLLYEFLDHMDDAESVVNKLLMKNEEEE